MKESTRRRDTVDWKTKDIISMVESGQLSLETEYQREIIWTKEKKSLLIDSMLNDIDIPKIYVAYFTEDKRYECIDGKQRISSIIDFYENKIKTPDDEINQIKGVFFKDLKKDKLFLDYEFSVSIIKDPSDDDISKLFYRLNLGEELNGGERIHAMRGEMRDFIFKVGSDGPFIDKVGIKGRIGDRRYRFSREIAFGQIVINSIYIRTRDKFVRARYEDLENFLRLPENKKFSDDVSKKIVKIENALSKIEVVFGPDIRLLNRKSAIVSAYLFCEELIEKDKSKNLTKFPKFYFKLLNEMKYQADLIGKYKAPTKKILLEKFQKNLQQASVEGYSIERRHNFIKEAFTYYLETGKIIGDE